MGWEAKEWPAFGIATLKDIFSIESAKKKGEGNWIDNISLKDGGDDLGH